MLALFPLAFTFFPQNPEAKPATPPPAVVAQVAEDLIPAHAFAVLRVSSLDRLAQIALPFQRIEDPGAQPVDVLPMLAAQFGIEAKWELIDHAKPVFFALRNGTATGEPAFTLIASASKAAEFASDPRWKQAPFSCSANGSFVEISSEATAYRLAPGSPLRAGLDRGDVVVRVDFQEVLEQWGDELRGGFRRGVDAGAAAGPNAGAERMSRRMAENMLGYVESIETLGFTLRSANDRMQLGLELCGLEGSVFANVPKVDTHDLATMASCIDPAAPWTYLGAMDMSPFSNWLRTIFDVKDLPADAPPELKAKVESMMSDLTTVYENMGSLMAGSIRFGKDGVAATYVLKPKDVEKLCAAYGRFATQDELGMKVEGPTTKTIAGHEAQLYRITPAPVGMVSTSDPLATSRAMASEMMTKLFGSDAIPFARTTHEGLLLASVGREEELVAALGRMAAKSTSPAAQELLGMLGTLNPGCAMHIDTAEFASRMLDLVMTMSGEQMPKGEQIAAAFKDCGPLRLAFGCEQRTWRIVFDADFVHLVKAFSEVGPLMPGRSSSASAGEPDLGMNALDLELMIDFSSVQSGLVMWSIDHDGKYPETLDALLGQDADGDPYVTDPQELVDPWGRAYLVRPPAAPGNLPLVYTLGADGKEGGEGADRDRDSFGN